MRGKAALISVTVLSLAVSVVSSVNAVAASRSPAASQSRGARASKAAYAARRLYDPVGVNGVDQARLLSISQSVTSALSPKVFAGIALNTHAGIVDLYLANTSAAALAPAMAAVPASERGLIRVHHVPLSEAALSTDMARAGTAASRLLSGRVPVQAYWPDFTTGAIVVTLYRPTAAQRSRASRALASLPAQVRSTATAITPIPPASTPPTASAATVSAATTATLGKNRAYDWSPWTGGDFIDSTYSKYYHLCTDSWPIRIGTKHFITTAGHCSPAGHRWINMTLNSSGHPVGDKKYIGTGVKNELKTRHHLDVQLLPARGLADVWSGHILRNYRTSITGHTTPPPGTRVCDDGAYEGTICGAKVNRSYYNACVISSDGKMCHLYRAHRPKGKVLIGQGDSGGPDYVAVGSTTHVIAAKGIGLNSLETVAHLKCPAFTWRGRVCSNVMFYTGLTKILKRYGAKLHTK